MARFSTGRRHAVWCPTIPKSVESSCQHLTRSELAFFEHVFGCVIPHPSFGGDGDMAILGNHPTCRAQPVSIERTAGIATIRDARCRPARPRVPCAWRNTRRRLSSRDRSCRPTAKPAAPSIRRACIGSKPPTSSNSNMLSSDCESDPVNDTTREHVAQIRQYGGAKQRAARHSPNCGSPDTVLISPLCARYL